MKITVKKEFTTIAQLPKVKEDIREFKERYTDGDLKSAFCDAVEEESFLLWSSDIVSVNITAFPGGTVYNDETQFHVTMLCRRYREFIEAKFYCDIDLNINTGDLTDYRGISTGKKMYSVDRYVMQ